MLAGRRSFATLGNLALALASVTAQSKPLPDATPPARLVPDIVGPVGNTLPRQHAAWDTTWLAAWSFDGDRHCDAGGWQARDLRRSDGADYWHLGTDFSGFGSIDTRAAVLSQHDLCWPYPNGYGNDWDQAIVCTYSGSNATLSFDYLLDSEPPWDSLTVEASQVCAPRDPLEKRFGAVLFGDSGLNLWGRVSSLPLPDFGAPEETHCVYIRFTSDSWRSQEDGEHPETLGAALVVDNVRVTGALVYGEDFEDAALDPHVAMVNSASATGYGVWARLYPGVTDIDPCTFNTTCTWIFSDPELPAADPSLGYGPEGAVVRAMIDNAIISPWVSLITTPAATSTFTIFREFGGGGHTGNRMTRRVELRHRRRVDNTDTTVAGDSIDCTTTWKSIFGGGGLYPSWREWHLGAPREPGARDVQVRYHVVGRGSPETQDLTGPGPFVDDVKIGRIVPKGPHFDDLGARWNAQDAFASEPSPPFWGENFTPSTDRFGTCDFASTILDMQSREVGTWTANTRDSIVVHVVDQRDAGGVTRVDLYGAIIAGPHHGKAPPPLSVGANGFFQVPATRSGTSEYRRDWWFVDLDDDYFRGGDVMVYCWTAQDASGGFSSNPPGLVDVPVSVAQAEADLGGLLEVSFLPTIDWDPAYLARIEQHPSGKLEPTAGERANSRQRTCILYSQMVNGERRSGPANRTSFMYTLDALGYAGMYDVYDHNGPAGGANGHIAGRATVEQARGYALIIQESGRIRYYAFPDGSDHERFFDQVRWYRDWLAQASQSAAGGATLWLLGDNVGEALEEAALAQDFGVTLVSENQTVAPNPDVAGDARFTWARGATSDFTGDRLSLQSFRCQSWVTGWSGRSRVARARYDALDAVAPAVVTHRYGQDGTLADGAVVAKADASGAWNSVVMGFSWADTREPSGAPPGLSEMDLAQTILRGALPLECQRDPDPNTDAWDPPQTGAARSIVTRQHPNVPNPFNPMTLLSFDLAHAGHVELCIYDVAGRKVRTLIDAWLERDHHTVVWDGRDDAGQAVSSGVYVSRLVTTDHDGTRKLIVLR